MGLGIAACLKSDYETMLNAYSFKNFNSKEKFIIRTLCITGLLGGAILFFYYSIQYLIKEVRVLLKEVFFE